MSTTTHTPDQTVYSIDGREGIYITALAGGHLVYPNYATSSQYEEASK